MDNQTKLSTEEILKELEKGNAVDTTTVDFIEKTEQLHQLSRKINEKYGSLSKFAIACELSGSHLTEFLNGKKQFSRDRIICICIMLEYDVRTTRQLLHRLASADLYSRNRRDFTILNCIQQGRTLDETNEILLKNGFDTLLDKKGKS